MLIPLGHDQTIRRRPWVTLAFMVICALVQLHRTFFAPNVYQFQDAARAIVAAENRLRTRLEVQHLVPNVAPLSFDEDGEPIAPPPPKDAPPPIAGAEGMDTEAVIAAVHARSLGDDTDPDVRALHDADRAFAALQGRDLAAKMAYHPERPLSLTIILYAFAHEGWLHLVGNLIFLWLCGFNLEDRWGHVAFGGFYLVSAIVAAGSFAMMHPADGAVIGASGAIAGAMGAFLVCYARARIKWMWIRLRPKTFFTPAYVALPVWFALQALQLVLEAHGMGVAYSAHVGGFVFGLLLAGLMRIAGLDAWLVRRGSEDVEPGWEESADFLQAESIAASEPDRAMAIVRRVLTTKPDHAGARLLLARLALANGSPMLVGEALGPALVVLAKEERWLDIVELTNEAEKHGAPLELDERAWFAIVRASAERGDTKRTVSAAKKLQGKFPHGSSMPRVLAYVAEAQGKAGRKDLAAQTWRRLLAEHPEHALAGKAREVLAIGAEPSP